MRKIGIIAMALTLILGLSQCKKEQPITANEGETVAITLDIQTNGSTRMDVNTGTGEVTYETGDVIYVASGGTFVGMLTNNGTNFGGTITNPTVGEPLHFYFLGNVTPAETLMAGTTTTCSVVISDQTEHLPVIEYAPSNEIYTAGATIFTAHLLNKCALVKFNVTTSSEAATCITGMKNKVTVNFAGNTLTHSQEGNGVITLAAGNGEKWAILLPQEAMEEGNAYSADGEYTGTCGVVPAILDNGYLIAGIDVTLITETNPGEVPVGAISGKFTINADGDQACFSKGNLQYQASTNTWRFAEHQWDYVGNDNSFSETNSGWIDLFGWGTSGYNHGAVYYQPWSTSVNSSGYYAYGNSNYNLFDETGQADWGYNSISNGGNTENSGWRTLTNEEWNYLLVTRATTSDIRYAKAQVNEVNGLILLPDNWTTSIFTLNNTDNSNASFSSNTVTALQWTALEQVGAVFLPAAGFLNGSLVGIGSQGEYWSSSSYGGSHAYHIYFNEGYSGTDCLWRFLNSSVRLVRDVE